MGLLFGKRRYESWETEKRMEFGRKELGRLAAELKAELKQPDYDELEIEGARGDRRFRIHVEADAASMMLRSYFTNRKGLLELRRDARKETDTWDAVDSDSSGRQSEIKQFVGKHVFVEEYPKEFEPMMQLIATLPDGLIPDIVALMNSLTIERLTVNAEYIEMTFADYYSLSLVSAVRRAFALEERLVDIFGAGDAQVVPKARLYLGGVAVPMQVLRKVECKFCGAVTQLDEAGRCLQCGGVWKAE